ncbi:MAG: hypothetical protein N2738_06940 [Thermodesulfovibrionales bacterium]|nr:hypothetical protein [Thermodesulfovibrionales bacterium]
MGNTFTLIELSLICVGVLWSITSFFLIRTLKQIDTNQSELFERLHKVETQLACLVGEHNVLKNKHHI